MWLKLFMLLCLIPLIWEDLKSREISLIWFLILSLVTLVLAYLQPIPEFWKQLLLNISFILLQFILLSCYFSIKNKRWLWVTQVGFGGGDIFLLVILLFFFPFLNYLLFYVISLLWTLLLCGLFVLFSQRKIVKLPLAGLQALLLALLIIMELVFHVDIRSEDWLLNHLPL